MKSKGNNNKPILKVVTTKTLQPPKRYHSTDVCLPAITRPHHNSFDAMHDKAVLGTYNYCIYSSCVGAFHVEAVAIIVPCAVRTSHCRVLFKHDAYSISVSISISQIVKEVTASAEVKRHKKTRKVHLNEIDCFDVSKQHFEWLHDIRSEESIFVSRDLKHPMVSQYIHVLQEWKMRLYVRAKKSTMRMFAKRTNSTHCCGPNVPTDQTHDFIHFLGILFSQIQNLIKLNKLFNNKMKIPTIIFATMAISSADAYPLLLPTGAVIVISKLSCSYHLKLHLVILLSVPMSLMLCFQKTWNASLTTLFPSSFQATSLAGDSILRSAHHRFAKSSPDNSLRDQRLLYGWLYRLSWPAT